MAALMVWPIDSIGNGFLFRGVWVDAYIGFPKRVCCAVRGRFGEISRTLYGGRFVVRPGQTHSNFGANVTRTDRLYAQIIVSTFN